MIRLIAAVRTTVIVTAWLLGVPAITVAVAGSPIPSRPPSAMQLRAWLENPLNPAHKAATATALGWIVWGLITTAILMIFARHLRTMRWAKIINHLPPPAQSLTAAILGTAVVATSTSPLVTPPAVAAVPVSDLTGVDAPHTALPTRDNSRPAPNLTVPAPSGRNAMVTTASPADHHGGLAAARPTRSGHRQVLTGDDRRGGQGLSQGHLRSSEQVSAHTATSPAAPSGEPVKPAPHRIYRVAKGDSLWDLATDHLGNPHRWPEIYQLNKGHVQANGYALTDPDKIDVGWMLALPSHHSRPANPAVIQPPTTARPEPPAIPDPSPATNHSRHAPHLPSDQARSPAPASRAAVSPSAPAAATPGAGTDHRNPATPARPVHGIDLPGGWITLGLGGALLAAGTMAWHRRRHHYRPTLICRPRLDDPDLLPRPAAMIRIRASLRRSEPDTLEDQRRTAPTVREYQDATVKPALPPSGPSGCDLAGAGDLPLSTGLGLTGDGAPDAARGLLVASLASGSDDDPDAKGRAIITAATLASLLGTGAANIGHLGRLTVTTSQADAITTLEEEIIRRSRLLADAQIADVQTLRDTNVHAEPMPQLLLITEPPEPAWTTRLITAVRLGHGADIGAIILGDWPSGTTLNVDSDGNTDTDTRLGVLDIATAIGMLDLLNQTHGDTPAGTASPVTSEADLPEPVPGTEQQAQHADHGAAPTAIATTAAPDGARIPVAVRVLGRPAVLDIDGHPSEGIRSKALELLVYLAVNRHGANLSDIMEALFPDATLRRASERLSTAVADLRKHIRRAAATPADTTETLRQRLEPIPNTGGRYHLDPAVVTVDWWTILDRYEAVAATTDTDRQLANLTAAIQATSGALAEGVEYDWVDTDREVVRRHRIKLHVHAAALLAETDAYQSWTMLEQACQIDPLSDELARAAIRAAAALGDTHAIRHRLETLREALDAHGLEHRDDTETLARELLRGA